MEFDRLVVDEAQDLTLTEFWMLLELLRACRERTGKSPWLPMAGDAGQCVEASGFEWGRYTELLSSRWRKPATFDLHEHVRCPARTAAVVNRSTIFYSLVDKNRRPEKQQPAVEAEHVTGHALYVRVERTEQANGLVEQLAALEGTAVITAADEPPAWLDERRRKLVLTPGEAKGLEYQRVCVLDVGAAIEAFDGNVLDDRTPLRQESRRTAIDQLRVALSRATETLAVVNVEPDARQDLSTLALVGGAGRYNQDDIIARFGDETATPEERTSERIRRAEAIVEEDPDRAWEIASQTVAEMGAPDVPNGVSDRDVRRDARATLMRTLALLLAAGEDRKDNVHLRGSLQIGVDMDAETEEENPGRGERRPRLGGPEHHPVDRARRGRVPADRIARRPAEVEAARSVAGIEGRRTAPPLLAGPGGGADAADAAKRPDRRSERPVECPLLLPGRRRGLAEADRLPRRRRGQGASAVRDSDQHAARRGRGRHERAQPEHPARPGREPAARQRVGAVAGRAARRGERAQRRGAGSVRTGRYGGRRQADPAQAGPRGRKRRRWTATTRSSSGCSRSTDSQQPGQPDSVRGCTSRNAAGWPKRWRRCATTVEPKRRCPDRRGQRPGSVRPLGESRKSCRCAARSATGRS